VNTILNKLLKLKTTYLFLFCIIDIVLYQAILLKLPEALPFAFEIGDIQYRICFAFITSYIFYVLMTFIPKERDKENVYSYVEPKKDKLIVSIDTFIGVLVEQVNDFSSQDPKKQMLHSVLFENRKLDIDNLKKQDFNDICLLLESNTESPICFYSNSSFIPYLWRDVLKIHADTIKQEIAGIFVLIPHLKSSHIKLLANISDTEFIRICHLGSIFNLLEKEPDMMLLHSSIYNYYLLFLKLKEEW
jgi:hypothetical protein